MNDLTHLAWDFLEEDAPFPSLELTDSGEPDSRNRLSALILLMALTVLVIGISGWTGERQLRQQIQAATAEGEIVKLSLRGKLAIVEMALPAGSDLASAQFQTRFLMHEEQGWQMAEPDTAYWGERLERQTTHFRFLYHALDAEAVESLASEVEDLYAGLLQDLDQEDMGSHSYVIEVVPEAEPALHPNDWRWLRLPSPHLRPRSSTLSSRDVLARRVANLVSSQLMGRRATRPFMATPDLRFMLDCLRTAAVDRWAPPDLQWQQARQQFVKQALAEGHWLDLSRFDYYLFDLRDRQQRTFQCSTVAQFIGERYGRASYSALMRAARSQPTWHHALETALGLPYPQFLDGWAGWIQDRFRA